MKDSPEMKKGSSPKNYKQAQQGKGCLRQVSLEQQGEAQWFVLFKAFQVVVLITHRYYSDL